MYKWLGTQAWAGFEVRQKNYAKAYELFAQALTQSTASGDTDRQLSLLKAWGDAKVLDSALEEAAELYDQALALQPDSLTIVVVGASTCMLQPLNHACYIPQHNTMCYV